MKYILAIGLGVLVLLGCTPKPTTTNSIAKPTAVPSTLVHTTVQGTRLQPDPVEAKLRELEQAGQLKILRTMESYPPQFEIETTGAILEQIQQLAANSAKN